MPGLTQKPKRPTTWYIEPIGGDANWIIAQRFDGDDACVGLLCADEERHDLWRCRDHLQITKLQRTLNGQVRFNVWRERGKSGRIERVSFGMIKKKSRENRTRQRQELAARAGLPLF